MADQVGILHQEITGDVSSLNKAVDSGLAKVEHFADRATQVIDNWGEKAEKSVTGVAKSLGGFAKSAADNANKVAQGFNRMVETVAQAQSRTQANITKADNAIIGSADKFESELSRIRQQGAAARSRINARASQEESRATEAADRARIIQEETTNARVLRLRALQHQAEGNAAEAGEAMRLSILASGRAKAEKMRLDDQRRVLALERDFQTRFAQLDNDANARAERLERERDSRIESSRRDSLARIADEQAQYNARIARLQADAIAQQTAIREKAEAAAATSGASGSSSVANVGPINSKMSAIMNGHGDRTKANKEAELAITKDYDSRIQAEVDKSKANIEKIAKERDARIKSIEASSLAARTEQAQKFAAAKSAMIDAELEANFKAYQRHEAAAKTAQDKMLAITTSGEARIAEVKAKAAARIEQIGQQGIASIEKIGEKAQAAQDKRNSHFLKSEAQLSAQFDALLKKREALIAAAAAEENEATEAGYLKQVEIISKMEADILAVTKLTDQKVEEEKARLYERLDALAEKHRSVEVSETQNYAKAEAEIIAQMNQTESELTQKGEDAKQRILSEGLAARQALMAREERAAAAHAERVEAATGAQVGEGRRNPNNLRHAGFALGMMGGIAIAPIVEATKAYTEFDAQLRKIFAQANERLMSFNELQRETLKLSQEVGVAPEVVASTLFNDESAGFHGKAAITMSRSSLRLATATRSKPEDAANLLTKIMMAYQLPADRAPEVSDAVVKSIGSAHTDMAHAGPAISNFVQDASQAHIELNDALAAFATVTRIAPNSNIGSTGLRNFFSRLVRPTPAMRKAAGAAGLDWMAKGDPTQHIQQVGLPAAIEEMRKATGGNSAAMAALFPDLRTQRGVFPLLQRDENGRGYKEIRSDQNQSKGATAAALAQQDQSLERRLQRINAMLGVLKMDFMRVAVEVVQPFLAKVIPVITKVTDWFEHLPPAAKKGLVAFTLITAAALAVGGAISMIAFFVGPVIEVLGGLFVALGEMSPVVAVIVAAVAAFGVAWAKNWGGIRDSAVAAWETIKRNAIEIYGQVSAVVLRALTSMRTWWNEHGKSVMLIAHALMSFVYNTFLTVWPVITGIAKAAWATIVITFTAAKTAIMLIVDTLIDVLTGNWKQLWKDWKDVTTTAGADLRQAAFNVFNGLRESLVGLFGGMLDNLTGMWREFVDEIKHGTFDLGNIVDAGSRNMLDGMRNRQDVMGTRGGDKNNAGGASFSPTQAAGLGKYVRGSAFDEAAGDLTSQPNATGPIGQRIAQRAEAFHLQGSAEQFRHYCERLLRITVQTVTPKFNGFFDGSARQTMNNFKRSGVGEAYHGQQLAPGTLVYSGRMGGDSGHAMIVGANGEIVDNVGSGRVPISRRLIDWVVNPDHPGGRRGSGGGSRSHFSAPHNGGLNPAAEPPAPPWLNGFLAMKKKPTAPSVGRIGAASLFDKTLLDPLNMEKATKAIVGQADAFMKVTANAKNYKAMLGAIDEEESKRLQNKEGTDADAIRITMNELRVKKLREAIASLKGDERQAYTNWLVNYADYARLNKEATGAQRHASNLQHGMKSIHDHASPAYVNAAKSTAAAADTFRKLQQRETEAHKEAEHAQAVWKSYATNIRTAQGQVDSFTKSTDALTLSIQRANGRLSAKERANEARGLTAFLGGEKSDYGRKLISGDQYRQELTDKATSIATGAGGLTDRLSTGKGPTELLHTLQRLPVQTEATRAKIAELLEVIQALDAYDKQASNSRDREAHKALVAEQKKAETEFQATLLSYKTGRETLVERVKNYGLDRDAFRQSMQQKSDDLAKMILGDEAIEGISNDRVLELVQKRIDAETTAVASGADAQTNIRLQHDKLAQAQLLANVQASSQLEKVWDRENSKAMQVFKHLADTVSGDMADIVVSGRKHAKSLKEVFADIFHEILEDIIKHFVENAILQLAKIPAINNLLGGPSGGGQGNSKSLVTAPGGLGGGGGGLLGGLGQGLGILSTVAGIVGQFSSQKSLTNQAVTTGMNAAMGVASVMTGMPMPYLTPNAMQKTASTGGQAAGAVGAVGTLGGGLTKVLGSGLGGAVSSAMPFIGAGLAVVGLLGSLFGGSSKPDFVSKNSDLKYSSVSGRDYTGMTNSGYSDVEGMRSILRQHEQALTRSNALIQQSITTQTPVQVNLHGIDPSNLHLVADAVGGVVKDGLARDAAIHRAQTGVD